MKRTAFAALACLALAGCATAGSQSGYLDNYDKLKRGSHLQGFHAESGLASVTSMKVSSIDTSRANAVPLVSEAAVNHFKGALESAAQKEGMGSYFLFDSGAAADADLNLALTKIDQGNANSRMWAGELGMGHAIVQVEGKVVSKDGKKLASFSEQRRNSGAAGLRDIGGDAGPALVNEMLDQLASAIVQELKAQRNTITDVEISK